MLYALAIALALAGGLSAPDAGERRVALLVAHPFGGEELTPLRYTVNDVERMRDVLQMGGGFAPGDVLVSIGDDAARVRDRFREVRERLSKDGRPSLFVFYYSGHAKDGELRLGESRLALTEVKRLLEDTKASLRVALLDACRAGSITRLKGAVKGEPITMAVDESTSQAGQVLITASSENEDAQESDDIQGSFFTHYVTSGLRGAADGNRDGKVTLGEAYNFAYTSTVARTVASRGGIQHPTFRFDMRGAGDVVLTRHDAPPNALLFAAELEGVFVVFDDDRKVVVAELDKKAGGEMRVAVLPGDYVLKKREADHVLLKRVRVRGRGTTPVDLEDMERVSYADDWAKGSVVTAEEVRYGKLGVRLSAQLGMQTFLSAPVRDGYVPPLGLLKLNVDFVNAMRRNLGVRLDVGFGGSGEQRLRVRDRYLGELDYAVTVSQLTGGVSLFSEWSLRDWLTLGAHARLGMLMVTRTFSEGAIPKQDFGTITPGVGGELAFVLTDWLTLGAGVSVHYMFFNGDESQSLAYLDGGLILTAVLQ